MIKIRAKLLSDVVIFPVLPFENPVDFHDKFLDVLVKNVKYFLLAKNIK